MKKLPKFESPEWKALVVKAIAKNPKKRTVSEHLAITQSIKNSKGQ